MKEIAFSKHDESDGKMSSADCNENRVHCEGCIHAVLDNNTEVIEWSQLNTNYLEYRVLDIVKTMNRFQTNIHFKFLSFLFKAVRLALH